MSKMLLALLAACLSAGCVATAPPRSASASPLDFGQIHVGMTELDVVEIMPGPLRKRQFDDGDTAWEWRQGAQVGRVVLREGIVIGVSSHIQAANGSRQHSVLEADRKAAEIDAFIEEHPALHDDIRAALLEGRISVAAARVQLGVRQRQEAAAAEARERRMVVEMEAGQRRKAYLAANPDLDPEWKAAVREGKVQIGMPMEAILASWGEPERINRTVTATAVREHWVYGSYQSRGPYLYMANGVLRSWQD